MKKLIIAVFVLTAILTSAACSIAATGNKNNKSLPKINALELLTGGANGTWYVMGAGIADKFNENYDGFPMTAIPGPGSLGNPGMIAVQDAEIGMSYGPFLIAAVNGEPPYERKYDNLRSICMIQPTVIQPMTVLPIKTLSEFVKNKIKATVGLVPVGNASTYIVSQIFAEYGLKRIEDIEQWGAKVYYADGGSLADAWADRHIDLYTQMLNVPAAACAQMLITRTNGKLISLDDNIIKNLVEKKGFHAYTIKAGTYEGQKEDCKTVALPIIFFTTKDTDESIVYNFVKSIYENKEYFLGVHSSFVEFSPKKMHQGLAIDVHPGAARFYKEKGLI